MAHSQKSIRDHARNRTHPNVDNEVISQQLKELFPFVPQLLELIAPKTLLLLDRAASLLEL